MLEPRIYFPGSPWPQGHAIEAAFWAVRLLPAGRVAIDVHIESADYSDAGSPSTPGDSHEDFAWRNWQEPESWRNYGSATISSLEWGDALGLRVEGRCNDRLDLIGRLHSVESPPDEEQLELALQGYVLSHNVISFPRLLLTTSFDGAVDLTLTGRVDQDGIVPIEFPHDFVAVVPSISFRGCHVFDHDRAQSEAIAVEAFGPEVQIASESDGMGCRLISGPAVVERFGEATVDV